jgi:hypothetical protein
MSELVGVPGDLAISDQEDEDIKTGIKSPLLMQAPLQVRMCPRG